MWRHTLLRHRRGFPCFESLLDRVDVIPLSCQTFAGHGVLWGWATVKLAVVTIPPTIPTKHPKKMVHDNVFADLIADWVVLVVSYQLNRK